MPATDLIKRSAHLTLLPLAVLAICACSSPDSGQVVARFALPGAGASGEGALQNEQGLFVLETAGAYVALTASAADMDTVKESWPVEPGDYLPGTDYVDLTLKVPAGAARRVEAIAFLFADGRPYAFLEEQKLLVDLEEGETRDITIELLEAEVGEVSGSTADEVAEVWLVDVGEMILLTSLSSVGGVYEFPFAPLNRELAVYWFDVNGEYHTDSQSTFVLTPDVSKHTLDL